MTARKGHKDPKGTKGVAPGDLQVCECIALGESYSSIARKFDMGRHTVAEVHRTNAALVGELEAEFAAQRAKYRERAATIGFENLERIAKQSIDLAAARAAASDLAAHGVGKPTERVEQTVQVTGELDLERADAAIAVLKAAKK